MIMKYILAFLLMLSTSCWAQIPMTGAGKSSGGAPPPSYQGPGDTVASATAFWSCSRAYTAAYAAGAGNACDIADVATGLTTCTMKFATNGFADLTSNLCAGGTLTVPAFCTAHTSCIVAKMYEQTGVTNCTTACDVTNRGILLAALTFNCIGTIPCVTFPGTTGQYLQTPNFTSTISQGCTYMGVAQRSSGTAQVSIASDNSLADGVYFSGSSAGIFMFAGSLGSDVAAANGSPHAFQAAFNAGSSLLNVDSSGATTVSPGSGACVTSGNAIPITGPSGTLLNGIVWEVGLWPVAFSGPQISSMNSNQHTQYGF